MCEYCKTTPHHPRCPLVDYPKSDISCDCCKEDIVQGEEYIEVNSKYYHLVCIESSGTDELLEIFNCEVKTKEDTNEQYTLY